MFANKRRAKPQRGEAESENRRVKSQRLETESAKRRAKAQRAVAEPVDAVQLYLSEIPHSRPHGRCLTRAILALGFSAIATGCASSTKGRVFQNMLIAGATGVLMGQQKEDYKTTYSTMYGGVAAAVAGAVTLYMNDPDKEADKLREEIRVLKTQMDQIGEPRLATQTPATFGAQVPNKYRAMINPGEWRVYEINQWVEDGENRLLHQDKIMELIPPSLKPNSK